MKIAYLTTYDSNDIGKWSGSGYFINQALRQSGLQTVAIDNLRNLRLPVSIGKKLYYTGLRRQQYLVDRDPALLRSYARQAGKKMAGVEADIIFSPGSLPLAYLDTDKPKVFWTDATFAGMVDFYPAFSRLCSETLASGEAAEKAALKGCHLAIYSSRWAADSAISHYQVAPEKVTVVPFGANLDIGLEKGDMDEIILGRRENENKPNLLFLGVDWYRKGGDLALAATRELRRKGFNATLLVAGCRPPAHVLFPWVKVIGFLDKERESGRAALTALLTSAHFLIMPSKAECFGLVFAEASAFGLPSLAADVGGVSSAVEDYVNGHLFNPAAEGGEYADFIAGLMESWHEYEGLCRSSFDFFKKRLNWQVAGAEVRRILEERFCIGE